MNAEDVEYEPPAGDWLEAIFVKQRELMEKYEAIERSNGFNPMPPPVDVDDRKAQHRLKDFAWRTTEELAEAVEAIEKGETWHFREELADALHFLVELAILAGLRAVKVEAAMSWRSQVTPKSKDALQRCFEATPGEVKKDPPDYAAASRCAAQVTWRLGLAMNCLKNKPWKQTHVLTDQDAFREHVYAAFEALFILFKEAGVDASKCVELYFRKSKVNEFRQRSAY